MPFGYSYRTEQTYLGWIKRYIFFHNKQHPKAMGGLQVQEFLNHLAMDRKVSSATQNQALNALVFMYRHVLDQPFENMDGLIYAKREQNIPTVLTTAEIKCILSQLTGVQWLLVSLMYGSGLRVMEAVRLRVKDFDFHYNTILVRNGKGFKDRVVTLPEPLMQPIQNHLKITYDQYFRDLESGNGGVFIPHALAVKYPNIDKEWAWQFAFPSIKLSADPYTGVIRRHHYP